MLNVQSAKKADAWPPELSQNQPQVHCILPGDKLSLSVAYHEDLSVGSIFGVYNSNEVYGKWVLVDERGDALFPGLGKLPMRDLTVLEAEALLRAELNRHIKDPQLDLRVLNREVVLLGEVRNPGTYLLETERHTLAEVLAKAGGIEAYADIRSVQFTRASHRYQLDLTNPDANLDLVLQSGDRINIPSRKGKMLDKKAPTLIPFASTMTAIVLVASLLLR